MKSPCFPLFAALLLGFSGCSKFFDKFSRAPEGFTNVRFSDGRRNLTAAMDGGMMVYALRQDGSNRHALHLTHAGDSKVFSLPNGQYKFHAIGWPASGMSGTPKCGSDTSANPVALTGAAGTVTVEIEVTDSNCNAAPFTDTGLHPSGVNPSQLVLCAATAGSFAGKGYADKCLTEESARFLKPGAGTGEVGSYTDYDSGTGRFLFLSDQYVAGRDDLYSVKADGTGVVRQNNPLVSGRNVFDFIVLEGRGKVAYASDEATDNEYDLWVSTIGSRGGTLVGDACTGCTGVDALYLTPDNSKLIVVGDMDTPGKRELYLVDLTATSYSLDKLSETLGVGGTGLTTDYGNVEISPDSAYVTYTSFQNNATTRELFTVRLSDQLVRNLSPDTPTAGSEVRAFFQNYDGTKVVWMSDPAADGFVETFASEIFPATPNPRVVSGTPTDMDGGNGRLAISRNADLVAFTVRNDPDKDEIQYANFSNLASIQVATAIPVGAITELEPVFDYLAFVTDGTNHRLVIGGDPDVAAMNELWVKDVAFPGSAAVKVSHSTMSSGIGLGSGGSDPELAILDYNTAYYIADRVGQVGQKEAWKVNLGGGANNATNVAQTPSASETFDSIAAAYGKIFLNFNDSSTIFPFLHDPTGSAANSTALPAGTLETVDAIELPRHSESFPGYPYGAFYRGLADGSGTASNTVKDLFLLANYATATPVRISNMFGGASGTGGVRLRLLSYASNGGTGITEVGSGLESDCINPPGTNGDITGHSIVLPLGIAGGTGPLAVALEVYTGTEDCAGSPDRIIFPHGLANPSASTSPSQVRLLSSGSAVRIYLND